ncbi:CubicO group peptidase (beta-lactamase class C family) [Permianibacter aggregans]|uniref:CubicO group peptidase (Beta-lactamase class C family) n=2 Tax=Permianibacter aggregans TaxID=1510150 RepID=A0A4R6UHQ3_9GAMM|nr:CubicO group peptidase (beta-lactamase class C family) [Permianibacter aggregans]
MKAQTVKTQFSHSILNRMTICSAWSLGLMLGCATSVAPPGIEELPRSPYWNAPEVLELTRHAEEHRSDALIIVQDEQLIYRAGQTVEKINTHSVRKSIMAVLYGIAIEKGLLNLGDTLEGLGYDDLETPLTSIEKQATIRDLLTSRSGIYIDASGQNWQRPQRHSSKPGESFFYNNWGFNALGEILERKAGMPLGEIIVEWLAKPLGMQHFTGNDVDWDNIDGSSVKQYVIYMSADDLTRVALLVANDGVYQGKRLVSANWIREMTTAHSSAETDAKKLFGGGFFDGYGYLWWTRYQHGRRLICADGWGGQYIIIDPETRLVLINRRNTGTHLLAQGWFLWRGEETDRPYIYQLFENINQLLRAKEASSASVP